jgi:hypothetical protein
MIIHIECTGNGCRKVFNLCENSCINNRQDQDPPTLSSTESPTQPKPIPTPAKTDLGSSDMCTTTPQTSIFCTSATTTITVNSPTISTVTHNLCKPTKIFLPTKAMAQKLSAANTPTACTPCQQDPKELVTVTVTSEPFQNWCHNMSTLTKLIISTDLPPVQPMSTPQCTPGPPHVNNSLASSGACSCADAISTLSALLGICTVVLVFVILGWVWTCWTISTKGTSENASQPIR